MKSGGQPKFENFKCKLRCQSNPLCLKPNIKRKLPFVHRQITFLTSLAPGRARRRRALGPEILDQVRLQQSRQQLDSRASPTEAEITPFRITQTGSVIRYTFTIRRKCFNCGWARKLEPRSCVGSTKKFATSRLDDRIGKSPVTRSRLSLLAALRGLGRRNCADAQLLAVAPAAAVARGEIFERPALGGQGERRDDANRGLRLAGAPNETFRGGFGAENRGPLVPETNAD